jgi:hypothetical protein
VTDAFEGEVFEPSSVPLVRGERVRSVDDAHVEAFGEFGNASDVAEAAMRGFCADFDASGRGGPAGEFASARVFLSPSTMRTGDGDDKPQLVGGGVG